MTTKTKTAHTPGPWANHVRHEGGRGYYVREIIADGAPIADIRGVNSRVNAANANLVAAAPDLLEALQKLLEQFDREIRSEYDRTEWITGRLAEADHARAALAKVMG